MKITLQNFPTADEIAETAELCRRAILTITALPDRERKWLKTATSNLDVIHDAEEAYGWTEEKRPRFRPTPRDVDNALVVLGWLAALKREPHPGPRDYKIIWSRAFGAPWWKLAGKLGRSDRQVQRYYENAIVHLTVRYRRQALDVVV